MKYKLGCKQCNTIVTIRNSYAYMRCMCDEESRIINIKPFVPDNLYLLETEGNILCQNGDPALKMNIHNK